MIYIILIVLGLCFGSFVNALLYRLHKQFGKRPKTKNRHLSILSGRSMCPRCKHQLAPKDLVPVLSWLSLGGKCRYCKRQIEDNPLIEAATGVLFVLSYVFWPLDFTMQGMALFILWLACLVLLVALFVYDKRWMLLPDRLVFPLIWLAGLFAVVRINYTAASFDREVVMLVLSLGVSAGFFYALFMLSRGRWIGGGDVKLGVALGLVLAQPHYSFLMLFLASTLGSIIALPLLIRGKSAGRRIPFGPLLIAATIIVFWTGEAILDWYTSYVLVVN